MKKRIIALLAALTLVAAISFAQTTFGIRAGVNFQNINGKDEGGDKLENDLILGYHAGFNAEIPVAPDFYFQPGLLFSTKGAKDAEDNFETKINLAYVELPLNLLYKPLLGNGHLILGFGPYVAYGIGGKVKLAVDGSETDYDVKFKNKVTSSDDEDVFYVKGIDAGANLFFGYEFPMKLSFQLNAQLGLLNLEPEYEGETDAETIVKNTGFGFSVGYRF